MKTKIHELYPYPGYEKHVEMTLATDSGQQANMAELQSRILAYTLGKGMEMKDIFIPGAENNTGLRLHVIFPPKPFSGAPVVMDIHGGGFTSGSVEIDNYRCIALAEMTPCIAVSVEYRLASRDLPFPAQLMDCLQAFRWLRAHAGDLGGDPDRIALHGTSAGGNLAAALALWLRDHGEDAPSLTILNCPLLSDRITVSRLQFGNLSGTDRYSDTMEAVYTNAQGQPRSWYALPLLCGNLSGLGPHMVIVAEYDPLRDEGLEYACRLLHDGVPCEIICAPRVTHGFCVIDEPLTRWTHRGTAASLRREFGMDITEI